MRILHAPTNVGNQAWAVAQGECMLGDESKVLVYTQNMPGYSADYNLHFERYSRGMRLTRALWTFLKLLHSYSIIHFYFATSFFPSYVDLPFLRGIGKKIFFTFQGCDIRAQEACPAGRLDPQKHKHAPIEVQKRNLQTILQYAEHTFVLNPDLLDHSPTSTFLQYASLAVPEITPQFRPWKKGDTIYIFHAPSDPLVKGTAYIIEAVKKLKQEGYHINLDLAQKISHDEVRRRAAKAHITIDQLLIGWYGVFAVEMMALGKPTICNINPAWIERVPFGKHIPLIHATPQSLTEVLKRLLDHPSQGASIARESRRFVERVHHPRVVAQITRTAYEAAFNHISVKTS